MPRLKLRLRHAVFVAFALFWLVAVYLLLIHSNQHSRVVSAKSKLKPHIDCVSPSLLFLPLSVTISIPAYLCKDIAATDGDSMQQPALPEAQGVAAFDAMDVSVGQYYYEM